MLLIAIVAMLHLLQEVFVRNLFGRGFGRGNPLGGNKQLESTGVLLDV